MSKVCHIISGLSTGGAERALWRLLTNGLQDDFDNSVICLAGAGTIGKAIADAGVPVHVLDLKRPADGIQGIIKLRRLLKMIRPDLLQGWMYHGNLAALAGRFAAGLNVPVSWNIRQGLDDLNGDKFSTRQAIRVGAYLSTRPAAIIYNSSASAREHEAFGYAAKAGLLIPNGFETEIVHPDEQRGIATRAKYALPRDGFVFVHLARWHAMKDQASFIEAAAMCARENGSCHFFLAGRGVAANATQIIAGLEPDIRSRFYLHDEIDDPVDVLQAANSLVVSSNRAEGFPNVLGEAMLTATACITTDVGDSPSVTGEAGLIVPHSNPRALHDAMMTLINNQALAQTLGRAGRERVVQKYDIKAVVALYRALYTAITH